MHCCDISKPCKILSPSSIDQFHELVTVHSHEQVLTDDFHFCHFLENLPAPPAELLKEDDDDDTFPEPPPDYDENIPDELKYPGLIPPHKLPNPVLDSKDRRQIHKDLKFNAKQ